MPSMTKEEVEKKLALLEQEIRESSPALPLSRTYGVVFAGGGGKASYQAGAIKALSDLGLMPRITCTAGASAGALSCVLLANGSVKFAEKIWRSISLGDMLDFELPKLSDEEGTMMERFLKNAARYGLCSQSGLSEILHTKVDMDRISAAPIDMYVSATLCYCADDLMTEGISAENYDKSRTTYTRLNGLPGETIISWLLASTSMPYVYPPITIDGQLYRDGGLTDLVPIRPLVDCPAGTPDCLIVIKLEPDDPIDTSLYSRFSHVYEIEPSAEIGDLIDGTLDFTQQAVNFRIALGYHDTLRFLQEAWAKERGEEISQAAKEIRLEQDMLAVRNAIKRDNAFQDTNETLSAMQKLIDTYDSLASLKDE